MSETPVNIGPQQRRRRQRLGIATLILGLAIVGLLYALQVTPWWRLGALPLFWIALLGFFQAKEKT